MIKTHSLNNIKLMNAQQAKLVNIYKNTKVKLHKTEATLWYNKIGRGSPIKVNTVYNF
jgi:hypothetical protein